MSSKLYFCVVLSWDNQWHVSSFGGRNKAEEKRFALSGHRKCILVTTDHDAAQRCAADARILDKVRV